MAKQQTELIMRLRAEDRKERATERSEDIATLSNKIGKAIDDKLEAAIKPLSERQEAFEKKTGEAISDMNAKISAFEARLAALPQQEQSYASVAAAIPRELIESRRGSETSLRGSFYSTQETSLTDLFFTLVRLVSETDFLPLQRLVSQRSKTGQRD